MLNACKKAHSCRLHKVGVQVIVNIFAKLIQELYQSINSANFGLICEPIGASSFYELACHLVYDNILQELAQMEWNRTMICIGYEILVQLSVL